MSKVKTFKDIEFKAHPNCLGAIRGDFDLPNNWSISVVAGPGFFSIPGGISTKEDIKSPDEVDQFEVAIRNEAGMYTSESKGWQTREDIDNIIKTLSETINRHENAVI